MPRYSLLVIRGGVIMGMFIIRKQKEFTWMDAAGKIYKGSVGNTSQLVKPLGDLATKKPLKSPLAKNGSGLIKKAVNPNKMKDVNVNSLKAMKKPTSNSGWYSSTTGGYSGPLYK